MPVRVCLSVAGLLRAWCSVARRRGASPGAGNASALLQHVLLHPTSGKACLYAVYARKSCRLVTLSDAAGEVGAFVGKHEHTQEACPRSSAPRRHPHLHNAQLPMQSVAGYSASRTVDVTSLPGGHDKRSAYCLCPARRTASATHAPASCANAAHRWRGAARRIHHRAHTTIEHRPPGPVPSSFNSNVNNLGSLAPHQQYTTPTTPLRVRRHVHTVTSTHAGYLRGAHKACQPPQAAMYT